MSTPKYTRGVTYLNSHGRALRVVLDRGPLIVDGATIATGFACEAWVPPGASWCAPNAAVISVQGDERLPCFHCSGTGVQP